MNEICTFLIMQFKKSYKLNLFYIRKVCAMNLLTLYIYYIMGGQPQLHITP